MKNLFTLVMIFAVLSLSIITKTQAQISVPGLPQSSLYEDLAVKVDYREFPAPDMDKIRAEDEAEHAEGGEELASPEVITAKNTDEDKA